MTLKHICAGLCVVVIFSVVNSSRAEKNISPDIARIKDNISGVKSLVENVIKNYKKLERFAISASEDSDENTDFENKQFVMDKRNKGRIMKVTMDYQPLKGKPSLYSGQSEREGASENNDKKILDQAKTYDNVRNLKTDFKEYTTRKPIKLVTDPRIKLRHVEDETESHSDESSADYVKDYQDKKYFNRGPYNKKNILVVHVSKGKPNQHNNHASTTRHKYMSSNDPKKKITKSEKVVQDSYSEEDKTMASEVEKASYLRQAYADVCHQVIIRKCLRALRAVLKDVCSRSRKCPSKYKDDFRDNGHDGCNQQFGDQKSACRMGLDIDEDSDSGKNERQDTVIKQNKPPEHTNIHEVNILRDRFDKLCKKTSFTKCRAACKHASDKTCKKHKCISAKEKALRTSCKQRCRETYAYKGGSEESEDEDGSE